MHHVHFTKYDTIRMPASYKHKGIDKFHLVDESSSTSNARGRSEVAEDSVTQIARYVAMSQLKLNLGSEIRFFSGHQFTKYTDRKWD